MIINVLTIFPELFLSPLKEGIIRRAQEMEKVSVTVHNIRDYAFDRHKMTDDRPFGGGEGMVMKPDTLAACLNSIPKGSPKRRVVLLSPRGQRYSQPLAEEMAELDQLILVCGRYEGVDQRFTNQYVDQEISIGDFILTGGELGAMILIDSIIRLLPGVLGCSDSAANDTFSCGLLKYSQYTRPREFNGQKIPDVLLSGAHAAIKRHRLLESVQITLERRPDLLQKVIFTPEEKKLLNKAGLAGDIEKMTEET
jgi:tRNA (guanine37-N1)-methyltransferase